MLRYRLPPVLLTKCQGSFTHHCSKTGVERTLNKSQHTELTLEKKSFTGSAGARSRALTPIRPGVTASCRRDIHIQQLTNHQPRFSCPTSSTIANHPSNQPTNQQLNKPFVSCPIPQLNEITPYLDGNLIYGSGKAVSDAVRSFKDGRLATRDDSVSIKDSVPKENDIRLPAANPPSPRDHVLRPVSRFYREFLLVCTGAPRFA